MPSYPPPPSPVVLLSYYAGFGVALSFLVTHVLPSLVGGRALSSALPLTLHDVSLHVLAITAFVLYYACADVAGAGRGHFHFPKGRVYETNPADLPKITIYSVRAQLNQAEQFPFFFAASLFFTLVVSARLGGLLSAVWVALRMAYSTTYRARANEEDKKLGRFTVPCYIIMGAMASAAFVHTLRIVLFA
jgi:uncharacterized MAPEG superfamily protein